ncbi:uncharacterized protein LOC135171709 [Diachasmimorpha longicaudata]|uniref:uncharacterized protein LOC135171709 n=1 Tax=Diachasmimorpha longicaudata TaxID=58733 RepID=UPI0030B918FE
MEFAINPLPESRDPADWVEEAFRDVYNKIIEAGGRGMNRMCLTFNFANMQRDNAWISPRAIKGYEFQDLWNLVSSIAQSANGFGCADKFWIKLHVAEAPVGQGFLENGMKRGFSRKCILQISNEDGLCLARSLVVAKAHAEKLKTRADKGKIHEVWQAIRQCKGKMQRKEAERLTRRAGVIAPDEGCGLQEVAQYQRYLAEEGCLIKVYSLMRNGKDHPVLYDGTPELISRKMTVRYTLPIVYYPEENHYEPIQNLPSFFGVKYYCEHCNKPYTTQGHVCDRTCDRCLKNPPCDSTIVDKIVCDDCNREFHGQLCFDQHKKPGSFSGNNPTVCDYIKLCGQCNTKIDHRKAQNHVCHKYYCNVCQKDEDSSHLCYMPTLKSKKKLTLKRVAFVFYDFETRQDELLQGTTDVNVHIPNLCVAQTVCDRCADMTDDDIVNANDNHGNPCGVCKHRENVFDGEDPVRGFVDYITSMGKTYKKVVCIAHNAKGYDSQFVLRDVMKRINSQIKAIINGTNIILMDFGDNKFIDSLNYFHMALASLPKAFGLGNIAKGYFPHFFNTKENQNYVGPIPDRKYYGADTMGVQDREKFLSWYNDRVEEDYEFDFRKEILHYCRLDVTILRRACVEFRKLIMNAGNVCPFTECVTIASTCMRIFQTNFLKDKQIGIIPQGGYRLGKTQSKIAIEWLLWREHCENHRIIHAGRTREHRTTSGLRLDGFWEDTANNNKKYAYQFHGCYWHGCPRCFKFNRDKELSHKDTLESRYERTGAITRELRHSGYEVVEMWECDFIRQKKTDHVLANFVENVDQQMFIALDPRDAFFGGRTGNTVTHYDVKDNEKIRYVDVCSLYPYVLKTGIFPIGHPTVHVGRDCQLICPNNNISRIEGLVKCRVLPPRQLFHPVLPVKAHGKLLFPLCRSCCDDLVQDNCPHDDPAAREFLGTWVAPELRKAVEMGYKILEISELWEYKSTTRYNPVTRTGGLFAEYINTFLKIKQEASDWPAECVDDESKNRYIAEYETREGIKLDKDKIQKNAGLRAVAKLCLNCLWGKFGERENLTKKAIIRTHEEFANIMFNPEIEVTGLVPVDNDTLFMSWKHLNEAAEMSTKANVVIAAYTTAHARLKLYSYLEKQQERVLYYDTDSVIYVSDGSNELPLGNFLGDLTDEVEGYGEGSFITSFVSGGPKFYTYRVKKPDGSIAEVSKIKGVRLNYESRKQIHYDSIRALVVDKADPYQIDYHGIRRTVYHDVITKPESKIVRATGPKRRLDGFATLPYGFKKPRLNRC